MFPLCVVISFDVFKQSDASVLVGFKYASLQKFLFKSSHEGFTPSIVIRIGLTRHALKDFVALECCSECNASILTSSITMKNSFTIWISSVCCLLESIHDEACP